APSGCQGAADAELARRLGVKAVFVLHDEGAYGVGVAGAFANAARKLGLTVAGFAAWDANASSFGRLALSIARTGAQAVFLGGLLDGNGGRLIAALRTSLPRAAILAPDRFTPISAVRRQAGPAADGRPIAV